MYQITQYYTRNINTRQIHPGSLEYVKIIRQLNTRHKSCQSKRIYDWIICMRVYVGELMFIYQIINNTWYCRTLLMMQVSNLYYPVTSEWAFQNCNKLTPTSNRLTAHEFGNFCELTGRFKCNSFRDFQLCKAEYSPKPFPAFQIRVEPKTTLVCLVYVCEFICGEIQFKQGFACRAVCYSLNDTK